MLFCAGHNLMPDGRILVSGGHLQDDRGIAITNFFSQDGTRQRGPTMAHARWYPTVTTLPDGRMLTMGGRDENGNLVTTPEILENGQWVELTGAGTINIPYYPRNFVAPERADLLRRRAHQCRAGSTSAGPASWSGPTDGPNHIWPFNRDYGTAVMYEPGKILYAGGGGNTGWGQSPDPDDERADRHGGNHRSQPGIAHLAEHQPDVGPAAAPELHDPAGRPGARHRWHPRWWLRQHQRGTCHEGGRGLESGYRAMDHARQQQRHAGLPLGLAAPARRHGAARRQRERAGRAAGGGIVDLPDEKSHEIFSPPYLFKGARPTITSAPATVGYGQTFAVATPNAAQVTEVRWIRLGSVTHAFDMSQRANTLTFTRTSTGVDVTAPANGNLAPPGHYLLFILNRNGVPSAGKVVRIQ